MSKNPFPGPQPYRAADQARFFAREQAVKTLANRILANPATTVFGPSGAGKSSLMQAGVIPALALSEGVRVVRVDRWPSDEKPLRWLVNEMFRALDVGDAPDEKSPIGLKKAILLAARRNERPILIYLDQIEQLFIAEHSAADMNALLRGFAWLIEPARRYHLHLVLSLREDYFGRLRDWTRERPELSASGFRVAPLSVGEMVNAMCRTAAEGDPPSEWDRDEIRSLMLQVRVKGQKENDAAEVQTAFGQIVCRALWDERVGGHAVEVRGANAEAILHRYLDATLSELGGLRELAQQLLEEHLIDGAGNRRLLKEEEARGEGRGKEAIEVLDKLDAAQVLHAEEHQGSRYFELGHDWLAKKVFERRSERKQAEAEKRKQAEEAARLAKERTARRTLTAIAVIALVIAGIVTTLGIVAWKQRDAARVAQEEARKNADDALRASRMAAVRELLASGKPSLAAMVLVAVNAPEKARGWQELAMGVLTHEVPRTTLLHDTMINSAEWSPDGKRIVTASGGVLRLWSADGLGSPTILKEYKRGVRARLSPDGARILAVVYGENNVWVWNANGSGNPIILGGWCQTTTPRSRPTTYSGSIN